MAVVEGGGCALLCPAFSSPLLLLLVPVLELVLEPVLVLVLKLVLVLDC